MAMIQIPSESDNPGTWQYINTRYIEVVYLEDRGYGRKQMTIVMDNDDKFICTLAAEKAREWISNLQWTSLCY